MKILLEKLKFMKTHFNRNFLEDSTETLRAIAHPIRIAIIDLLYNNGQSTVTDIYKKLKIEQAIASHHLRILKNKKVVNVKLTVAMCHQIDLGSATLM